ncbi:MAG: LysE/ArgO family amino acid transporter [Actinobacteria bacterium]|nr:LysE/ArgO family amino acid transporter [Actinomycetota bacterium]
MDVALAGFLTGLSLIVAIGAQNAYVLRLGLARNHVGVAVVICAGADALLIAIGVGGLGAIVQAHGDVLTAIGLIGGAYLLWFAFRSFRSALHPDVLLPSQQEPQAVATVALAVLGLTVLNPHVYLDTILLVGTIGASFGADRWWFALGAAIASVVWFSGLGFGARLLSPLMARPVTWRVLDAAIGVVMLTIAIVLVRSAVL